MTYSRTDETQDCALATEASAPRKWLTTKQAACYLGLTVRGLEGYVRRGQLKAYKPFGRLYFNVIELDEIIMASRKGD